MSKYNDSRMEQKIFLTRVLDKECLKALFAIGAFACSFGVNAPCLFAESSKEILNTTSQIYSKNILDDAEEIENLRQRLLKTTQELYDYKSRIFRSSHPNDQIKIAELGQLLAEKDALNNQIANELEKAKTELLFARKQHSTNETVNDALSAFILSQRNAIEAQNLNHKKQIEKLETSFQQEKDIIAEKIKHYEADQQILLTSLAERDLSGIELNKVLIKQQNKIHTLLREISDFFQLFFVVSQLHKENLAEQAANDFTQLELAGLIAYASQNELQSQSLLLSKQIASLQNQLEVQTKESQMLMKHLYAFNLKHAAERQRAVNDFTQMELSELITNAAQNQLQGQIRLLSEQVETLQDHLKVQTKESQMLLKHLHALTLKYADAGQRIVELETKIHEISSNIAENAGKARDILRNPHEKSMNNVGTGILDIPPMLFPLK